MERLHFECPVTGRDIDAQIESEMDTLLRIRTAPVRLQCPACGQVHQWTVREAQLQRAA